LGEESLGRQRFFLEDEWYLLARLKKKCKERTFSSFCFGLQPEKKKKETVFGLA
jgi:hypothetical protein